MAQGLTTGLVAVLGSLAGGSTSIVAAWLAQRVQGERETARTLLDKRERLYSEFITEASRLAIQSMDHSLDDPTTFFALAALRNRIRLLASPAVMKEADQAVQAIMQHYAAPNLDKDEMRRLALTRPADPLKAFSEACRRELLVPVGSSVRAACESAGDPAANGSAGPRAP